MTNFSFYMRRVASAHKMLNLLQLSQEHFSQMNALSIYGGDKFGYFKKKRFFSHLVEISVNKFIIFISVFVYRSEHQWREWKTREARCFPNKKVQEENHAR